MGIGEYRKISKWERKKRLGISNSFVAYKDEFFFILFLFIHIHYFFFLRGSSENCSAKLYCSIWAMRLRRRLSSVPSAWSSSRHTARSRRVLATARIPLTRSENASKQFNELMSGQNVIVRINEQIEHNYTGHTDFYTPIFY